MSSNSLFPGSQFVALLGLARSPALFGLFAQFAQFVSRIAERKSCSRRPRRRLLPSIHARSEHHFCYLLSTLPKAYPFSHLSLSFLDFGRTAFPPVSTSCQVGCVPVDLNHLYLRSFSLYLFISFTVASIEARIEERPQHAQAVEFRWSSGRESSYKWRNSAECGGRRIWGKLDLYPFERPAWYESLKVGI